jgi:hypothetical protein
MRFSLRISVVQVMTVNLMMITHPIPDSWHASNNSDSVSKIDEDEERTVTHGR